MAKKQLAIISGLTNARNRTLVIVLGVIIFGSVVFAVTQFTKSSDDPLAKEGTATGGVPKIKSVPGGKAPEKYVELQREENVRKAEEALQKKTAAIPTIIGAIQEDANETIPIDLEPIDPNLPSAQEKARSGRVQLGEAQSGTFISSGPFSAQKEREQRRAEVEKRRQEQIDRIEREKREKREREERIVADKQREIDRKAHQASVQRIQTNMKKYVEGAHKEWAVYPVQNYVSGKWASEEYKTKEQRMRDEQQAGGGATTAGLVNDGSSSGGTISRQGTQVLSSPRERTVIKAGTVLFGVLDTAINTDEPGPILATIVHGKLKGAKLVGKITHEARQEKALLTFETLSLPTHTSSIGVSIVAIDPDTARTALASDVDKHYLMRYGSLFASSFLEGYAKALSEQGTTTTVSPLTGATTQTRPELSGKEEFMVALGEVGKRWGQQMRPIFNRPYTVTINQGTGLGLLFVSDADVTPKE